MPGTFGILELTEDAAPVAAAAAVPKAEEMILETAEAPSSAVASNESVCDGPCCPAYLFQSERTDAGGSLSGADAPVNHPDTLCIVFQFV